MQAVQYSALTHYSLAPPVGCAGDDPPSDQREDQGQDDAHAANGLYSSDAGRISAG